MLYTFAAAAGAAAADNPASCFHALPCSALRTKIEAEKQQKINR